MKLDPNTHVFIAATAFLTAIAFAVAVMALIRMAIHLLVPGAG